MEMNSSWCPRSKKLPKRQVGTVWSGLEGKEKQRPLKTWTCVVPQFRTRLHMLFITQDLKWVRGLSRDHHPCYVDKKQRQEVTRPASPGGEQPRPGLLDFGPVSVYEPCHCPLLGAKKKTLCCILIGAHCNYTGLISLYVHQFIDE